MQHPSNSCVLDEALWRFDEISRTNPSRAEALESVGPPGAIVAKLVAAFDLAIIEGTFSVAREYVRDVASGQDWRAVVQFQVGRPIFDAFFNSRSGYRAHFRKHYECGLAFNDWTIASLCHSIAKSIPEKIPGRKIVGEFQDCGAVEIPKDCLLQSLVPRLSKLWCSTVRINPDGGIKALWPHLGFSGEPRILVEGAGTWMAPYPADGAAWIDLKGAFIGGTTAYQPKDPIARAISLHNTGEA